MRNLAHLLAYVSSQPWLIEERRGLALAGVLARRSEGLRLGREEIDALVAEERAAKQARVAAAAAQNAQPTGVAVVPIVGTLVARETDIPDVSGGGLVSVESVMANFRSAAADPRIATIILDVDSPGGMAAGIPEAAAEIAAAPKPVVAVANTWMCSAAYFLGSQGAELVASPSAELGSVGVLSMHFDYSKQFEMEGVKPTLVRYGDNKAQTSPYFPLSDAARADMERLCASCGVMFDAAVARGRGVSVKTVREKFGQGRVFDAREAVGLGMADRVATLEETIARFQGGGRVSGPRQRAAGEAVATGPSAAARARELDLLR